MSVAVQDLAETYLRFAAKIGVISDSAAEKEIPSARGKETKDIGAMLVEKGILHPNNFKLLESMFARQLSRMTHAIHPAPPSPVAQPIEPREPVAAKVEAQGFGSVKGDTTKLKGSAQATTRYRVVRPLATTKLSELFVAEDVELHREVVLKRLHPKHQRAPGYRIRFNRTAEVTSGLEHPNIPPIYNHGLDADGRPYYTTRYLVGESLADSVVRLHNANPADPPRALDTKSPPEGLRRYIQRLLQVCNALSYAHSRGVMHCGLSPDSILLGKHGETLVVGWGRSELIYGRRPRSSKSAKPSATNGERSRSSARPPREASESRRETPHAYTSPEQLNSDSSAAGILSDVYSLGAILFFTATGQSPFAVPPEELPALIQEGLKPSGLMQVEKVSASLARICDKAMSVDPMERHSSVREFASQLEDWLNDTAVSSIASPTTTIAQTANQWSGKKQTWLPYAFGGACVLSGLLGIWIGGIGKRATSTAVIAKTETPLVSAPAVASTETPTAAPVQTSIPWVPFAAALFASAPEAIETAVGSIARASAMFPKPTPKPKIVDVSSLLDAAEAALTAKDEAGAARLLKSAEPLLVSAIDDEAARSNRLRWASAVGVVADRTTNRNSAVASLQAALAASESRRRADDASWGESRQSLARRLARLQADDGRFADAILATDVQNLRLDATLNESSLRFLIERAEWIGFAGRAEQSAAELRRLGEFLASAEASSIDATAATLLRFRVQAALAEQLLALGQSPATALDDAGRLEEALKGADPEIKALRARLGAATGAWLMKSGKVKEAEAALAAAVDGWSKAPEAKQAVASDLLWRAAPSDSLRKLFASAGRAEDSLAAAARVSEFLERIPERKIVADRLSAIDNERAALFVPLGKYSEAEAAYSRVLARGGASLVNARYLRAACRLELKDAKGAREDAELLAKEPKNNARYLAARVFARLSGMNDAPTNAAVPEDGGRAISLLSELSRSRFFTGDKASLPMNDKELEALRQRADFKALFAPKPVATATANP